MKVDDRLRLRFESYVVAEPACGCWLWLGGLDGSGYGKFSVTSEGRRKLWGAHRVSWILAGGSITKDRPCILHRCDNRACVNPDHLYAGTILENNYDRALRNRNGVGPLPHGVRRSTCGRRYRASIHLGGDETYLGYCNSVEEAANRVEKAKKEFFRSLGWR